MFRFQKDDEEEDVGRDMHNVHTLQEIERLLKKGIGVRKTGHREEKRKERENEMHKNKYQMSSTEIQCSQASNLQNMVKYS